MIESAAPGSEISIHTTLDGFSGALRQYHESQTIAVILTALTEELLNILLLRELLRSIPSLLILPDDSKETVSKGSLLQPRYICCLEDDLSSLHDVLQKMVEKYNA